ncbi:acyl-CoA dehydrogenase family protein [Heyndrickxia coagulans]|uniref:Acyl-CoA dehydrogenase/oxidase N-terminal domain-containing protein n=1 Tax=Heyndrickxia coagulans TaxID=1398 RepID=A0A150JQE9_HEYCO|nr:acyl-CoA dehydrogenase family protein [Heyndrickxia coagulans]KYC59321.1 hypothetical protein B4099_3401 [Heyndrickxia coagulans]
MVSFQPTDEEQAFFRLAKDFAVKQIRPEAGKCEQQRAVSGPVAQKAEALGFCALELPESHGGMELALISQVFILQALSFGDLGIVQGLPGAGDAASLIRLAPEKPVWAAGKNLGKPLQSDGKAGPA